MYVGLRLLDRRLNLPLDTTDTAPV
jgi:hypothetical protein